MRCCVAGPSRAPWQPAYVGRRSWPRANRHDAHEARGLTRASVTKTFEGDIAGESSLEYLMMYRSAESTSFVGMERIVGRLGDRSGSFVLQHVGKFEEGATTGSVVVVLGSGTEGLRGLHGEGRLEAREGENDSWTMILDYDFE